MSLIDVLKRLDQEATPGPWDRVYGADIWANELYIACPCGTEADARLIALVRTLLPLIIAELEAGRESEMARFGMSGMETHERHARAIAASDAAAERGEG